MIRLILKTTYSTDNYLSKFSVTIVIEEYLEISYWWSERIDLTDIS